MKALEINQVWGVINDGDGEIDVFRTGEALLNFLSYNDPVLSGLVKLTETDYREAMSGLEDGDVVAVSVPLRDEYRKQVGLPVKDDDLFDRIARPI